MSAPQFEDEGSSDFYVSFLSYPCGASTHVPHVEKHSSIRSDMWKQLAHLICPKMATKRQNIHK
jgi:hypothetical protein